MAIYVLCLFRYSVPDGSVAGFGWRNIWAVGGGIQQKVSKSTRIMAGYNYSGNPVPDKYTFFNTPAPAIVQHHVSGGIMQNAGKWDVAVTYYHAFQNSITGQWISAQGPIPGTSVTSKMSENSVTIGLGRSFWPEEAAQQFFPVVCNTWD